ncbi:MAG: peptidoglycan DD-metalloendopeptidase family protein [Oscillospiraceae bacterium]|nr:peptidoglycan DD-metalloendopeptidase family protein [Oscillospiraceae bacterium]
MNRKKSIRVICIILAVIMALSLIVSVIPIIAHAEEDEEPSLEEQLAALNEQKEAAKENVKKAQNKVEQLKEEQALVIEEKIALEERDEAAKSEIAIIEEEISLISAEIAKYERMILAKEQRVVQAKAREDEQLEKYRIRLRAMEENGTNNILGVILNAGSLSELLTAIDDYGDVMNSDVVLYNNLQEARREHEAVKAEYVAYKEECETVKAGYNKDLAVLEEEKAALEQQIEESEALIEEYTEKIREAEEEQKRMEQLEAAASAAASNFLADYYARQAAAAAQAAQNSNSGSVTGLTGDTGAAAADNTGTVPAVSEPVITGGGGTGGFVWPFPGHYNVTSPYGHRASTGTFHSGIDIDGFQSMGSPIVAADSGTVIKAEYYGGYGNCIIIDHGNGFSTLYAHLSSMYVGVGSFVSQGQTIAGVGNTGNVYGMDGIHLHFEVSINGSTVDPRGYV